MVSIKDLTPLLLGGAVIFVVARSGILKGLGGVGEGVSEAAEGLGAGISTAGRGLGGGIGMAGQATGLSVQDVLSITAFARAAGAVGGAAAGEVERFVEGREREHGQEQEIDIIAHEQEKQNLARIQAEQERKDAEEQAERNRLIEEEKTQYVKFVTEFPEMIAAGFKYIPAGLSSLWRYSPTGLLTSYIMGQSSIEAEAAPQQSVTITGEVISEPTTTGGGVSRTSEPTTTGGGGRVPSVSLEVGETAYFDPEQTISITRIPSEPEPSIISKIGGWFLRRFTFI